MSRLLPVYDVIVVGAGHAGCEAACAAANLGSKTLLITLDMNKIAQMSCNPAMGGIAKGQIVREIDALGGGSGIVTDKSTIQFRMLNLSKGPAMWSPRAQCDRMIFSAEWRDRVEHTDNLDLWQDDVIELLLDKDRVTGVKTKLWISFSSRRVILTNGTFLNGLMHIGRVSFPGGRISEPATYGLSDQLKEYGFAVGRMKTGTPVRIDGRSIDFSKLTRQDGDNDFHKFSFLSFAYTNSLEKRPCYIAYTNKVVHDILREGFDDSPLFNGTIKSIGPRYCPSIEDKLVRFADKERHQLFLEPESKELDTIYIQGFSTSMPIDVQEEMVHSLPGLEHCVIEKYAYAIEYDAIDPLQMKPNMESKIVENLFTAGQVNGTSGYEEAAGQGLMAGANAALKVDGKEPFVLRRDEAYIGVMLDDLCTKGTKEPYRLLTSRAEYRLLLRHDNADQRLLEKGYEIGLVSQERYDAFKKKMEAIEVAREELSNAHIKPNSDVDEYLDSLGFDPLAHGCSALDLIKRPKITVKGLAKYTGLDYEDQINEQIEIQTKYAGYIAKAKRDAKHLQQMEKMKLAHDLDYENMDNLSLEARQKLTEIRPLTLGQASRISGINPSDIAILAMRVK